MKKVIKSIVGLLLFLLLFGSRVNAGQVLIRYTEFQNVDSVFSDNWEEIVNASQSEAAVVLKEEIGNCGIELPLNTSVNSSDVILLHFAAKAQNECGKINVKVNSKLYNGTYSLPTEETEYILPISGFTQLSTISISLVSEPQPIEIGNVEVINCGVLSAADLRTGQFLVNAEKISIDEYSGAGFSATDVVTDNEYLYSLHQGVLIIYSLENPEQPKVISSLSGLGNSREMALNSEKNLMAVSARENGVFLVDLSDVYHPQVISTMNSVGLPTGISLSDQYCFVSCRRQGVEIYDISDPYHPQYCGRAFETGEEYYDCCVEENRLYVSSWAEKKITVFDLSNICEPVILSSFQIDGCGAGCEIRNHLLYVATGYNMLGSKSKFTDPGYGMGNGFDIYDVSDPMNPQWLSSSKIDGRYVYSGFDHWRVKISGNRAYVTNAFNGLFVYEVSDPRNPVREMNYYVNIPKSSPNYKAESASTGIYTYDVNDHGQAIASAVAVTGGYIYLATTNGTVYSGESLYSDRGLYVIDYEQAEFEEVYHSQDTGISQMTVSKEINMSAQFVVSQVNAGNDIWSVYESEGFYYAAAGSQGILVYDSEFNQVAQYQTSGKAIDVIKRGQYFYVAEGNNGLGVYTGSNNTFEKIGSCSVNKYSTFFSELAEVDGSNEILVQCAWQRYGIVDVTNPKKPKVTKTVSTGTMYSDSLCSGTIYDKDIMGVYNRKIIAFYEKDENGHLILSKQFTNSSYSETSGMAVCKDRVLITKTYGYVYFNPTDISGDELTNVTAVEIPGLECSGIPTVSGDMLVISNAVDGIVSVIDISDIDQPVLLDTLKVGGTPFTACGSDGQILVPMIHEGMLVCMKKTNEDTCKDGHHWALFDSQSNQLYCSECEEVESADSIQFTGWVLNRTNERTMYLKNGQYCTGYQEIDSYICYFDSEGYAYTGFFTNGGKTYYAIEGLAQKGLLLINDKYYYFDATCAMKTGTLLVTAEESNGLLMEDTMMTFIKKVELIEGNDGVYCYVEGIPTYAGLIEYEGSLYYINSKCMVVTGHYYVSRTNNLLEKGYYDFDIDGKMLNIKHGIVYEEDGIYYYQLNKRVYAGLIQIGPDYYYANSKGMIVTGTYYVNKTNDLMKQGKYEFDETGKMILTVVKNGIYEENGVLYYYQNDKKTYAGLFILDGNYYYANSKGIIAVGTYYVNKTNDLMKAGKYEFDETGKMILSVVKNGIYEEDGVLYYYQNDKKTYAGLFYLDGYYYYANSKGIIVTGSYYVNKSNDLMPSGRYEFDESGRMIFALEQKELNEEMISYAETSEEMDENPADEIETDEIVTDDIGEKVSDMHETKENHEAEIAEDINLPEEFDISEEDISNQE